jgi:aminopeptidase N
MDLDRPAFKLLKEIKSIKNINETNEFQIKEILKNQLRKGKTIIERIDAARALKKHYYEELLIELRAAVMNDPYYGVSVEAANTLGSYNEKSNYSKSDRTYNTLVACMCDDYEFSKLHPEIKQAIVRNIGHFRRKDSVDLLSPLLNKQSESYFVRAKAATAIGKSMNDGESSVDNSGKENMIYQLKQIVDTTTHLETLSPVVQLTD